MQRKGSGRDDRKIYEFQDIVSDSSREPVSSSQEPYDLSAWERRSVEPRERRSSSAQGRRKTNTAKRREPPRRRRPPEEERPRRKTAPPSREQRSSRSGSRSRQEEAPRQRGRPPTREERSSRKRPPSQKKEPRQRKPLSKAARRILFGFTLMVMIVITAALCVFLLFKIQVIEVTGDSVYEPSQVLDICGFEEGENLVFLSTKGKEEELEEKLPYIEDVKILRKFPTTLEIQVTAATEAACVSSGGQWFAVSDSGKILEQKSAADEGVMEVTGLTLQNPVPGKPLQAQDETYQKAFNDIFATLAEQKIAGEFTKLDLTDLYNITMMYQGRIEFQLGSTVELSYKVDYGYRLVTQELEDTDTGTLNLSLAGDVKRAYFTPSVSAPETSSSTSSATDSGDSSQDATDGSDTSSDDGTAGGDTTTSDDGTSQDGTGGDETSTQENGESQGDGSTGDGRDSGIPDGIFTGE